jgi:hypothetical protein
MAVMRLSVWDEVDEFLFSKPSPEEVIAFAPSAALTERAEQLLGLQQEGNLTVEERAELEEIIAVENFVLRLKAKAVLKLAS